MDVACGTVFARSGFPFKEHRQRADRKPFQLLRDSVRGGVKHERIVLDGSVAACGLGGDDGADACNQRVGVIGLGQVVVRAR
ncbi:hypothetical protein D3C71_1482540 [compost metagenome]